jgi:hypothetical protein
MQAISTTTLVLKQLRKEIEEKDDSLKGKLLYDPTLNYDEIIRGVRRLKRSVNLPESSTLPLLAYNRGSLQPNEEAINERGRMPGRGADTDASGKVRRYHLFFGFFEFRYVYIANNITDLEAFELLFQCGQSIKALKTFEVNYGTEGSWKYHIHWDQPEDIEHISVGDNTFHWSLAGTARVVGGFLVFPDSKAKPIAQIVVDVEEENQQLIERLTIT